MWEFEKTAGQFFDHTDDPGAGWSSGLADHWPEDLPEPEFGKEASNHAADLTNGQEKIARYPVDTPEDALASSMYFLAYGRDPIEKEAHAPIARNLKQARIAHGVSLPESFKQALARGLEKNAAQEKTAYADPQEEHLPVSSAEQCESSVRRFRKHASRWSADDRMVCARRLQHAADQHDLSVELDLATTEMAKSAADDLKKRREVMGPLDDHPRHVAYMTGIKSMINRLPQMDDYRDLLKAAAELEELDKEAGLDQGWNDYFPDPARTFVVDHETDPLAGLKTASQDWSSVDFEQMRKDGALQEQVIEKIAEDPETIVPTLPRPQKQIVEEYA